MRQLLLILSFTTLFTVELGAQVAMWVGESREFDVSSSVMGSTRNLSWSTSGGYLSLSGSGFYRRVTVTQYFKGTAYVECSWDYQLYYGGSWTTQRKTIAITCNDNPVSIYPTVLTLAPGQSDYLAYTHKFTNSYTSAANAYFSSDGGGGAISVTRDGMVTAHKVGTAYVNVYSKISSVSPYCIVYVKEIDPTSVSIRENLTLIEGESFTITPTLYPTGATSSYTWTSDDSSVASVNSLGKVTALKKGKTRIKVTTSKGNCSDYCEVTVKEPPVPPTSVTLPKKVSLYRDFSTILVPVLVPEIAETTFKWSVDDASVVSVSSDGRITANSVGQAQVMVTTANGLTATCLVVVTEIPEKLNPEELKKRIAMLNELTETAANYVE